MKVTLGEAKRKFVYDVKFGRRQVRRIMYGGRQIWPDETARITRLHLDMSVLNGNMNNAYWLHALDAVEGGSHEHRYMKLRAGGRDYLLQRTYGTWKLATYSGGTVSFGDDGPYRGAVRVGDEVDVALMVPSRKVAYYPNLSERKGYDYESDPVVVTSQLPVLNYTQWLYEGYKGGKKENPWNRLWVRGVNTGRLYFDGWVNTWGGKLRPCTLEMGMKARADGDSPVRLELCWGGQTGGTGYLVYPSFRGTLTFRVTGVEYNK